MCLELIFQRELDDPWRRRHGRNHTETGSGGFGVTRISEIRVIEDIEELRAEFQIAGLVVFQQLEVFLERHVEIRLAGPGKNVAAGIAEASAVSNHRLNVPHRRRRIEILVDAVLGASGQYRVGCRLTRSKLSVGTS